MPQGSILGPLLFLLYINDMPTAISFASIALFADDAKLFACIRSLDDCVKLQNDLNNLISWSNAWMMNFNVKKCNVLSVSRSINQINFRYSIVGSDLERVHSFKDLGVLVSSDLSWNNHVKSVVSKSNRVMGMIKRSIGYKAAPSVTLQLYKSLVLSNLEFSSCVWSPQDKCLMKSIESVQRAATQYILGYPDMNYTERCVKLDILPLSYRREILDLNMFHKSLIGLNQLGHDKYVTFVPEGTTLRSGNRGRLVKAQMVHSECFKQSYFNRIGREWNVLDRVLRDSVSHNVFKNGVKLSYRNKLNTFNTLSSCTWSSTCRCQPCLCNIVTF